MRKKFILTFFLTFFVVSVIFAQSVAGNTQGIDSSLLAALQRYARLANRTVTLNWSGRTNAEQQALWDKYLNDGGHLGTNCPGLPECPLTGRSTVHGKNKVTEVARPGTSKHELGQAADVSGLTFNDCALLNQVGLCHTVRTEQWHVELGSSCISHP